jgi:hypothetical protein
VSSELAELKDGGAGQKGTGTTPSGELSSSRSDIVASLVSEAAVLTEWPVLSKATLTRARKSGRIAWIRGKRGSAWYRPSAIEEFIKKELEQPCRAHAPDHSLNSKGNGLLKNPASPDSIDSGVTPALAERVAQASAHRILKPQKAVSQK